MPSSPSFAYIAQGSASKLAEYDFPADRSIFLLTYDRPLQYGSAVSLFDKRATWSQGRNRLLRELLAAGPLPDYIIFCDDDVEFLRGDFTELERAIGASRPFLGVPAMPKAVGSPTFRPDLVTQRVLALDEQIVALHRDALGMQGITPLIEDQDDISWYVAPLVFEYLVLSRFGAFCHQYNDVAVLNEGHTWVDGGTLYHRGDIEECLRTWRRIVTDVTGDFDPAVVEQFDPGRESNLAARMQEVANISPWQASPATAAGAGRPACDKANSTVRPELFEGPPFARKQEER